MSDDDDKFNIVKKIQEKTRPKPVNKKSIRKRIDEQQAQRKDRVSFNQLNAFVHELQVEAHKKGWHEGLDVGYTQGKKKGVIMGVTLGGFFIGIASALFTVWMMTNG